ncbi:hypothetical protein INS49_014049 [Diaporthe citri]|uniref:uncharacterized protein n=1 Tax=Diaporthe citri TaxID=83186 RepID=UPI001C7F31CF|nr:uncharacterized protein INS49_014049 [Diaporthe citri]KAG6358165.1 hypothetical protein INS49_014049 [Diaporthe citri]
MADTGSISTSEEGSFFISESMITEAVKAIRPIPRLPTERATSICFTKVYDAIVPVQWTFDSDCIDIVRGAPLTSDAHCCQHKTADHPRSFDLNSSNEAAPPDPHSRPPPTPGLQMKRSHNETSTAPGNIIGSEFPKTAESAEHDPKRPKKERKSVETLVGDLVSLILLGQERLKRRRRGGRHLSGIQAILSRCAEEDSKHVLGELSKEFHRESQQKGVKSDSWDFWYFKGCMDFVSRATGDVAQSTSAAKAIFVINSVVDRLLVTDGVVSMVIFGALAESGTRLTYIARADAPTREKIISLAVQELHEKLHIPPAGYQIPNAAVWVAMVKNRPMSGTPVYSFQDACRDLAFPNLAALDLEPQWVGDSSSKNLLMKVDFSLVEASWRATGVNVQQPMASESETTQPDSSFASNANGTPNDHEAGNVTPTGHTGFGFGDSSGPELDWPNLYGGVANMESIDFGCESDFGQGSLDGIMYR